MLRCALCCSALRPVSAFFSSRGGLWGSYNSCCRLRRLGFWTKFRRHQGTEREIELRFWLSGPRMFGGLIRPGILLGREDLHPRLPSWRRYELRHGLQEGAKARGEPMTKDDADYCIDKALATGLLDSNGGLNFHFRGSREEIIAEILEKSAAWGMATSRAEAERLTDRAIRAIWRRRVISWLLWAALAIVIWAIISALSR